MVGFARPAAHRVAGTYMKLLVKSAKWIKPFSKYPNEEEYLLNFNTKFRVMRAAVLQSIRHSMTRGDSPPRMTHFLLQVKSVRSHENEAIFQEFAESQLQPNQPLPNQPLPNHDSILLEEEL
jgi:hypothetical protein